MLRKVTQERFLNILRDHRLTSHSFAVSFGSTVQQPLMEVRYLLNQAFFFRFTIATSDDQEFDVERSPGDDLLRQENRRFTDLQYVFRAFEEWLRFVEIEDEIPEALDSDLSALKEQFFKELGKRINEEDSFFTREEAADLMQRIDALEAKLAAMAESQEESEQAIDGLKRKMKEAKTDIPKMTKRKWKFVGGGKILDGILAIAKSREGRTAIVGGITKLLSDGK